MVLHNENIILPHAERSLALMAAAIGKERTGLPPDDWPMPPCKHIRIVKWVCYVREGKMQRSNVNNFWAKKRRDAGYLPFEIGFEPHIWTYWGYTLKTEAGFEIGAIPRPDMLWWCDVTLIVGFCGPRKRLFRDYRRCIVSGTNSDGVDGVALYDVILSPTDGLFIVNGSDRPQDPSITWSDMMYSIWFGQASPQGRYADKDNLDGGPQLPSRFNSGPQ